MGELSKRDERIVRALLKRAAALEREAEWQTLDRYKREKLQAASLYRLEAEKLQS